MFKMYKGNDIPELPVRKLAGYKIEKFTKSSEIPKDAKFLYAREEITYSTGKDYQSHMDIREVVFYYQVPKYVLLMPKES